MNSDIRWNDAGSGEWHMRRWGTAVIIICLMAGWIALWQEEKVLSVSTAFVETKKAALTFDDGPNARYTPILLDGLKKRNIRASFFLIGENIEGNEDILLQMRKDGHLIGNHTWDHVQLDKIPAEKARLEIEKTNNRIYEASGIYPSYVRPPFGA